MLSYRLRMYHVYNRAGPIHVYLQYWRAVFCKSNSRNLSHITIIRIGHDGIRF